MIFFECSYIKKKNKNKMSNIISIACNTGSYGIDCKERCSNCLDVYKCLYTNGTCLTGCVAGYQGNLCKTREFIFQKIKYFMYLY